MELTNQPAASDRETLSAGAGRRGRAPGAVVRRGSGRSRSRGVDWARLLVRHPCPGERPGGRRACPRARRTLAPPHRPRAGGRAVGFQSRSDTRGRIQRDRTRASPSHSSPHCARDGDPVRRSAGRRERVDCRASGSRRSAGAGDPVSRACRRRSPRGCPPSRRRSVASAMRWRSWTSCRRTAVATSASSRLRSSLSVALNSGRGYAAPEVEQNLDRVFTLSRADGGHVPVRWLWVAFTMRFMLGDLKGMRAISEEALARSLVDPSCRCEASHAMGRDAVERRRTGRVEAVLRRGARRVRRRSSAAFRTRFGPRRVHLRVVHAHAVAARRRGRRGRACRVRRSRSPGDETTGTARRWRSRTPALLHQMRRDTERTLACAEAAAELCERYGFAYYGDWAQRLDRVGPRTEQARRRRRDHRVGARAARRESCASAPAVLPVAAGGDLQSSERARSDDDRFSIAQSRWRSSAAMCGGFPRYTFRKASSRPGLSERQRFSTRSRWRGHNKAARSSSGFSRRQSPHHINKRPGFAG